MKDYRNSMPLQPPSHRLLCPLFKSVHVLEQKKAVHQVLGNTTPFTFFPCPYTSICGERLAVQLKCGLSCLRCLGGRRRACPDLSLWLLNDNTLDGWGGVMVTTSPGPVVVCLVIRCLFQVRPIGGEASDLGLEVVVPVWFALPRA